MRFTENNISILEKSKKGFLFHVYLPILFSNNFEHRVDEGVEIEPPPMEIYNQRGKIKETSDGASIQWEKVVEHQKGHAASIAACAVIASDVILQEEVVVTIHQKFDTLVLSSPESDVGVSLVQEVQI